ncbi:uncharacterized protein PgNI_12243 [Pyricularia grisea]|uniref:Uncharacterized protein n=1 Tax=Pyricularia grisea TaxID=148305 RepID=A0A6P8AMX2_PYRGI|nr:uncharacterized protein PgNI_12243 [Pyricularia grisea]TLD03369.1 hypothetical protein PgNI_12243 [Pyricularia grisea]
MATAIAPPPRQILSIPGLHLKPTLADMRRSNALYNSLPDDADQPQVDDVFIAGLRALVKKFNVHNKFGFHLVHGHVKMAAGNVMFGRPMNKLPGFWTRPIQADKLDLSALHGFVFVLCEDNQFHPYEYRAGTPPVMTANDDAFIYAARKYFQLNNLTDVIGIEVLEQDCLGKYMKEFVLSDRDGTVMLPSTAVKPTETYRTTGWNAADLEPFTELKGNESSHSKTTKGTHQVFTDGKALPDVEAVDVEDLIIEALREASVVN